MTYRVVCAAILALGTITPCRAVVLRYKFEAGETFHYADHLAMAFEGEASAGPKRRLQIRSDSRIEERVTGLDGDVATLEIKAVENQTERSDETGQTDRLESLGTPERIRIGGRGSIIERADLGDEEETPSSGLVTPLDEFAIIQQVFDALSVPEEDVEPGAEWTTPVTVNLTPGTDDKTEQKVEARSRFARYVVVRGERCAELVTDFTVPLREPKSKETQELGIQIGGRILGHLTTYFGIERGRALVELATLGVHGTFSMAPPGATERLSVEGRLKANIKTVLEM